MTAAPVSAADRALVADWAHLTLPPGARDLVYHHERGADPAIWLRVVFPARERDDFVRGAGLVAPLQARVRYVTTAQRRDQPWWRPDDVAPFESGQLLQERTRPRHGKNVLLGPAGGSGDDLVAYVFVTGL
ncbi:MAG: hypothetical protein KJZ91_25925 [Myxococcales bacterium]|nr:hypothetical protein [Myxococcales bacterium]